MGIDDIEINRGAHDQVSWRCRPAIAAAVSFSVIALPVAISVGAAITIEHLVTKPASLGGELAWWLLVLGSSTIVLLGCERLARRALPLAALLKMGMLFPGIAPKRLAVARRAGSTRDLARRLEEARSQGIEDEPVIAAERIITLAASLSAHDRKTRGHTERVRAAHRHGRRRARLARRRPRQIALVGSVARCRKAGGAPGHLEQAGITHG